jgi:pyridinium-3,5-bisthiocarboxylic acid mononucleotide nickel chelatase
MTIAYLDTIAGISGDMTLGALVSAGLSLDELTAELQKLGIGGFEIQGSHIERNGIVATKIEVVVDDHGHGHRQLKDVVAIIDGSSLSPSVKDTAKKIFWEVAVAEAKVHATSPEQVHFHEVGAVDSLVDIVGVAVCLEMLGVEEVYSSPVKVGRSGFVRSQHGMLPVPTPATMEILKGYPVVLTDHETELTTPTGAAIVKALSRGVLTMEQMTVHAIGYGAGGRELKDIPNLFRVFIGARRSSDEHDEVFLVETNIDNMNPELYPYVIERLLAAGALDAFLTPVVMKKGRPGVVLTALTHAESLQAVTGTFFRETSTIGVRTLPATRQKLERRPETASTSLGTVRVKIVVREGKELATPEFEDCKRIALEQNMPLLEVYETVRRDLDAR